MVTFFSDVSVSYFKTREPSNAMDLILPYSSRRLDDLDNENNHRQQRRARGFLLLAQESSGATPVLTTKFFRNIRNYRVIDANCARRYPRSHVGAPSGYSVNENQHSPLSP